MTTRMHALAGDSDSSFSQIQSRRVCRLRVSWLVGETSRVTPDLLSVHRVFALSFSSLVGRYGIRG